MSIQYLEKITSDFPAPASDCIRSLRKRIRARCRRVTVHALAVHAFEQLHAHGDNAKRLRSVSVKDSDLRENFTSEVETRHRRRRRRPVAELAKPRPIERQKSTNYNIRGVRKFIRDVYVVRTLEFNSKKLPIPFQSNRKPYVHRLSKRHDDFHQLTLHLDVTAQG